VSGARLLTLFKRHPRRFELLPDLGGVAVVGDAVPTEDSAIIADRLIGIVREEGGRIEKQLLLDIFNAQEPNAIFLSTALLEQIVLDHPKHLHHTNKHVTFAKNQLGASALAGRDHQTISPACVDNQADNALDHQMKITPVTTYDDVSPADDLGSQSVWSDVDLDFLCPLDGDDDDGHAPPVVAERPSTSSSSTVNAQISGIEKFVTLMTI